MWIVIWMSAVFDKWNFGENVRLIWTIQSIRLNMFDSFRKLLIIEVLPYHFQLFSFVCPRMGTKQSYFHILILNDSRHQNKTQNQFNVQIKSCSINERNSNPEAMTLNIWTLLHFYEACQVKSRSRLSISSTLLIDWAINFLECDDSVMV